MTFENKELCFLLLTYRIKTFVLRIFDSKTLIESPTRSSTCLPPRGVFIFLNYFYICHDNYFKKIFYVCHIAFFCNIDKEIRCFLRDFQYENDPAMNKPVNAPLDKWNKVEVAVDSKGSSLDPAKLRFPESSRRLPDVPTGGSEVDNSMNFGS